MTRVLHGIVRGKTIEVNEDLTSWEGRAVELVVTLTLAVRTLQSNPEEWVKRLNELVAMQAIRPSNMDDSRESNYAGRGE